MGVTMKRVSAKLQELGHEVHLERADGYFYFWGAEVNNWLDRTVKVPTLGSLRLEQWVEEFERLKMLNRDILDAKPKVAAREGPPKASRSNRRKGA